jgi:hypothetical protein
MTATAATLKKILSKDPLKPNEMNRSIETDIPARLDRLPWSRWHSRIIIALGTSWLLDGSK